MLSFFFNQRGGGKCSLCKSPGVTKATCPMNPDAKNPKPDKHPLAKAKSVKKTTTKTNKSPIEKDLAGITVNQFIDDFGGMLSSEFYVYDSPRGPLMEKYGGDDYMLTLFNRFNTKEDAQELLKLIITVLLENPRYAGDWDDVIEEMITKLHNNGATFTIPLLETILASNGDDDIEEEAYNYYVKATLLAHALELGDNVGFIKGYADWKNIEAAGWWEDTDPNMPVDYQRLQLLKINGL